MLKEMKKKVRNLKSGNSSGGQSILDQSFLREWRNIFFLKLEEITLKHQCFWWVVRELLFFLWLLVGWIGNSINAELKTNYCVSTGNAPEPRLLEGGR